MKYDEKLIPMIINSKERDQIGYNADSEIDLSLTDSTFKYIEGSNLFIIQIS